jgi:hypothetical protein
MARKAEAETVELPPIVDPAGLFEEPEDEAPPITTGWRDMAGVPMDRPVYLTADPVDDPAGTLSYWRTTRQKINGRRGWHTRSFWAAVLSRRPLEFEPQCWRESLAVRPEVAA